MEEAQEQIPRCTSLRDTDPRRVGVFAGEENAKKSSDVKTRGKLAIEKFHVADSRRVATISTHGVGD
jgi:hypothetical protein